MSVKWWKRYGYTLQEIGDNMKITRQRVRQLAVKGSPRIDEAVRKMQGASPVRVDPDDIKKMRRES
jgi:DNA-directed RNA polymerase sigma subunit (sigma70/sigma32)